MIYTLMKVSHEKIMWLLHSPILSSPYPYPNAVTVHQCRKMPQIHYVPSLCYTVLPMVPHTMCTKHNTPQSLLPPSSPALPHPSPVVLFCSFSFASLLYSTNEGNHLAFVSLLFKCKFFRVQIQSKHFWGKIWNLDV